MRAWPLIEKLSSADNILLAGAGGGFDVYSAIPLYFALKKMGKRVVLANYSFAQLGREKEDMLGKSCVRVHADSDHSTHYAPEHTLCRWFREHHNEEVSVYAYSRIGEEPMTAVFNRLYKKYDLEAVVLVDGGTDSLMRGDEFGLGTPEEDIVSMLGASRSKIPKKYLMAIGFGVDSYHGVCHAQFLEAVASLTKCGAGLGVTSLLPDSEEALQFEVLVNYANARTKGRESVVANSILSAVQGEYGDIHRTARTEGSKLWINPLMGLCWGFKLEPVVERNLYAQLLVGTRTLFEVNHIIERFRAKSKIKPWESIPH